MALLQQRACGYREAGFTLVEMLVVLAVLALATALAAGLPAQRHQAADVDLRLHAVRLAAALKTARAAAINRGQEVAFVFNADAHAWAVEGLEAPVRLPRALTFDVETARFAVRGTSEARLVFFPDGSATGGRVTLGHGPRRVAIGVAWLNGAVSMETVPP